MKSDYEFIKKSPPHDTSEWVKIKVHIRNNDTKQVRIYEDDGLWDEDTQEVALYIWEEGNFACDCNRQLFWWRANNENEDETPCGDSKFSVNIYSTNGKLVYKEFEELTPIIYHKERVL